MLYLNGLEIVLSFKCLALIFSGTFVGIIFGALPGLTATAGVAIFLPLTIYLDKTAAILVLVGCYCGGVYGGSISGILMNIPGTPSAIMTSVDGYALAKKGEARHALGVSLWSSFIGGMISAVILAFLAPQIARFGLRFSAQEYFAVAILGVSMISYVSGDSLLKGFISGILGLLIGTIGQDPITAYARFTYERVELLSGLNLIPVMIGMFGLSELLVRLKLLTPGYISKISAITGKRFFLFGFLKRTYFVIIRSSIIGVIVGAIPGTGSSIASIVAYGQQHNFSKRAKEFGKGSDEGICAAESANNAGTGGALIPTLALGIPGDPVTAVLLGAFLLHGIIAGPMLFQSDPTFVSSIFIGLMIANFCMLLIGLFAIRFFIKMLTIPEYILIPIVFVFCVIGSYVVNYSIFDAVIMVSFGVFGLLLKGGKIPGAPLILGLILGPMAEENLRKALIISDGDWTSFFTRPISGTILTLILLIGIANQLRSYRRNRK